MPLCSPESVFLFFLNLSFGLAFVYGRHGGDVQVTVAVYPLNVGAHVHYAGCDGGSDVATYDNPQRVDGPLDGQSREKLY